MWCFLYTSQISKAPFRSKYFLKIITLIMIKTKKIDYLQLLYIIFILFIISLLLLLPKNSISSFYDGVTIWATKVLPTLLPFFILTKILSSTKLIPFIEKKISLVTKKLYGVGGVAGYIYIMSIISGYPVGAKLTSDLYIDGKITRNEAISITSFTSTSGPLFIIGSVAVGLFDNIKIGIIILLSHYIGAILNGLLYRNKTAITSTPTKRYATEKISITNAMSSSILAVLNIGGFIALFYMIISLLLSLNVFYPITKLLSLLGLNEKVTTAILSGLIEVTTGEIILSKLTLSPLLSTAISTFVISFGGLSIHAQAYTYLNTFDMPYRKFLLQKLTHATIATIVAIMLSLLL